MDYAGWIQAVCSLLEYQVTDATSATPTSTTAFNTLIPSAIDYTELRIQRDLDLLATTVTSRGIMAANQRAQTLPQINIPIVANIPALIGTPIPPGSVVTTTDGSMNVNVNWESNGLTVGQSVSFLTPLVVGGLTLGGDYNITALVDADNFTLNVSFNASSNDSEAVLGNGIYIVCTQISPVIGAATRSPFAGGVKQPPLEAVSRDYLDYAWPDDASLGAAVNPLQWCPDNQTSILVGPAPPTALVFETVGTMRIPELSSTNVSNYLTQQFPDLYVTASLVFFFGYQRDFGGQAENPQTAQSWESQYQTLLKGAVVEEVRKNFANQFPSPSNPSSLKAG